MVEPEHLGLGRNRESSAGFLVSLIPYVGPFLAPFVSVGVVWLIEWSNEEWRWLDAIKEWIWSLYE